MDTASDEDILSAALSLEDTYHAEGFSQGTQDGAKAGLYEGRHFGLAQAYAKFRSIGQVHGRAIVWTARCTAAASEKAARMGMGISEVKETAMDERSVEETETSSASRTFLPLVIARSGPEETLCAEVNSESINPAIEPPAFLHDVHQSWYENIPSIPVRTRKHITTLYALTEPESLALENSEDAVSDREDRWRRAVAKAGLVGRMLDERITGLGEDAKDGMVGSGATGEGELEDLAVRDRRGGERIEVRQEVDYGGLEIEIH